MDDAVDEERWYEQKSTVKSVNSEEPLGMEEVAGEEGDLLTSSVASEPSALGKWMAGFKYAWLVYIVFDFANVFKSFIGSKYVPTPGPGASVPSQRCGNDRCTRVCVCVYDGGVLSV